jgi:hypothetical protein
MKNPEIDMLGMYPPNQQNQPPPGQPQYGQPQYQNQPGQPQYSTPQYGTQQGYNPAPPGYDAQPGYNPAPQYNQPMNPGPSPLVAENNKRANQRNIGIIVAVIGLLVFAGAFLPLGIFTWGFCLVGFVMLGVGIMMILSNLPKKA